MEKADAADAGWADNGDLSHTRLYGNGMTMEDEDIDTMPRDWGIFLAIVCLAPVMTILILILGLGWMMRF